MHIQYSVCDMIIITTPTGESNATVGHNKLFLMNSSPKNDIHSYVFPNRMYFFLLLNNKTFNFWMNGPLNNHINSTKGPS